MTLLREKQGILDPSPTKHTAVLFVNVKVEINYLSFHWFIVWRKRKNVLLFMIFFWQKIFSVEKKIFATGLRLPAERELHDVDRPVRRGGLDLPVPLRADQPEPRHHPPGHAGGLWLVESWSRDPDTQTDLRDLLMSTCIPLAACLISGVALCMMHTKATLILIVKSWT